MINTNTIKCHCVAVRSAAFTPSAEVNHHPALAFGWVTTNSSYVDHVYIYTYTLNPL